MSFISDRITVRLPLRTVSDLAHEILCALGNEPNGAAIGEASAIEAIGFAIEANLFAHGELATVASRRLL